MKPASDMPAIVAMLAQIAGNLNDGTGVIELHYQRGAVVRIKRSDVFLPEQQKEAKPRT